MFKYSLVYGLFTSYFYACLELRFPEVETNPGPRRPVFSLGMWQMLTVYGVGGKLLKAVQSFYVDSRAFVWVGNDVSEWFPVNVGLRQGCVMSPRLFNVYMDGVVREVNVWVLGKGLELLSANGGRFEINQLLFADDTALVADSEDKLCRLVSEFGRVCETRKLRVNVGKSKVMREVLQVW